MYPQTRPCFQLVFHWFSKPIHLTWKSWNFIISFSGPGKSSDLDVGRGKSSKISYAFYEWKAMRSKVEKLTDESKISNLISVEYTCKWLLLNSGHGIFHQVIYGKIHGILTGHKCMNTVYLKCCLYICNCDDQSCLHTFLCSSNIWSFIQSLAFFTFYRYIKNSQRGQLPVGLIAQLVEHCTSIAEVMGSNPIQTWIFCKV